MQTCCWTENKATRPPAFLQVQECGPPGGCSNHIVMEKNAQRSSVELSAVNLMPSAEKSPSGLKVSAGVSGCAIHVGCDAPIMHMPLPQFPGHAGQ